MNFFEYYNQEEIIFSDDVDYDDVEAAYRMAKKHGISILTDKDLYAIIKRGDDIAGALWTSFLSDEYSFDIVVNDKYQGRGIGKKLVDIAIDDYKSYEDAYGDEASLKAYVVNKEVMIPLLKRKGFEIEKEYPDQTVMRYAA